MTYPMRLPTRLARWADQLAAAELCYGIDPHLLAAILDRESLGGDALRPPGPAGTGDGGNGHGLGQIDGRYHRTFVAARGPDGVELWKDPAFNILFAAKLLRMNMDTVGQDQAAAVVAYNASMKRVLDVCRRLPPGPDRVRELDALTTGGNYVSSVLAKRDSFLMTS